MTFLNKYFQEAYYWLDALSIWFLRDESLCEVACVSLEKGCKHFRSEYEMIRFVIELMLNIYEDEFPLGHVV